MSVPRCDPNQLERLLLDDLEPGDRQAAEAHLDTCETCRERLDDLAATPELWTEIRSSLSDVSDETGANAVDTDIPPARIDARVILNWLAPTDDPEMIGRLGPYEIQGIIGSGGMGVVLKGWDRALRRFVAIKMLAPHLASGEAARLRFLRESRAAAAVVHENVVAIHGVSEAGGLPYFVMPYSRGESLQKRLDRVGPLAVEEILRIALQTARGLAAAHAQGLVHRDVKPANILLDEGVERVLLTDFGLARAVDDATLTRSGVIAGTPQYMSPEQIRAETVDTRADLFSLGATIYAMCTGHAPFRAESTYGILRQITDTDPAPIADSNPEIPEWLGHIVTRLLAKEPAQRFSSARELAELLEACLANLERSREMPLEECDFSRFGIVFLMPEDSLDEPDDWLERVSKKWAGVCAGHVREFARSRGGIALGTLTLLAMTVIGFVINTEPPDVAGIWHGDDWGNVKLEAKAPGMLEGTFDDTVNGKPGKLKLQWSRVERRYVGEWHEGDDRFGKISLRLDGNAIRGAITTDPASKVNPGTPQLADLAWFRGTVARSFGTAAAEYAPAHEAPGGFAVGRSFGTGVARSPEAIARGASGGFGLARATEGSARKDLAPFQGKWLVVEEKIRGKERNSPAAKDRPQLKAFVFRDDSLMIEREIAGESDVTICPKVGDDFEVVIMNKLPNDVFEGHLLILKGLPQSKLPEEAEFRIEKDDLELKFEPTPDHPVMYELRLQRVDSPLARALPAGPDSVAVAKEPGPAEASTTRTRAPREERTRNRAVARDLLAASEEKPADENSFVFEIAPVEGLALDHGQPSRVDFDDLPTATAEDRPGVLPGNDVTAKVVEVPAPAIAETYTIATFPEPALGNAEGTRPAQNSDVLLLNVPKQFPDDYAVVGTYEIRPEKPSLTLKASWTRGDTETIRTITVQLSETSSTALIRVNPILSITWSDGKTNGTIGDPKSGDPFSLVQFELMSDKALRVKCWAEKPRKPENRLGELSGQSPLRRRITGMTRYRVEAEAKTVEGKLADPAAMPGMSSRAEAKTVEGKLADPAATPGMSSKAEAKTVEGKLADPAAGPGASSKSDAITVEGNPITSVKGKPAESKADSKKPGGK